MKTSNKRTVGIRNIAVSKDKDGKQQWHHLLFYDIDSKPVSTLEMNRIDNIANVTGTSYLLIETKHGYHFVGLTPLTPVVWAWGFTRLNDIFNSFYSGQVLRLTPKAGEIRTLARHGSIYPIIQNIIQAYSFILPMLKVLPFELIDEPKFRLVFEAYKTGNL